MAHSASLHTQPGSADSGSRPVRAPQRRWTADEDAYVAHWYSKVGIPASLLCGDLGRSEPAVTHRIYKLGLKQPPEGMAVGNRRRRTRTAAETGSVGIAAGDAPNPSTQGTENAGE